MKLIFISFSIIKINKKPLTDDLWNTMLLTKPGSAIRNYQLILSAVCSISDKNSQLCTSHNNTVSAITRNLS